MENRIAIFLVTFLFVFMGKVLSAPKERTSYFEGDEHELIGNKIDFPRELGITTTLTLPNGIQLTFGQIVALAGDFFALPNEPIIAIPGKSKKKPNEVRKVELNPYDRQRFMAAYRTLAYTPRKQIEKQVAKLVKMIDEDLLVREGKTGTVHTNAQFTLATNGKLLELAAINFDHFQPQAPEAYLVGHQLAIETARQAASETDAEIKKRKLMEALSIDAFACHFLTDCFASGHIRTTRVALHYHVSPSCVGDLLSKYMHDEDCKFGVRVKNKRNDAWIAYGDGYFGTDGDKNNFDLVIEAVKTSASQVLEAYQNPDREINSDAVTNLIPFVDPEAENNTPLFQIKDGKLHIRVDLNDLQSKKTSSSWTGAGRVAKLSTKLSYNPTNSALPPA